MIPSSCVSRIHALAQELILGHQPHFFGHALQAAGAASPRERAFRYSRRRPCFMASTADSIEPCPVMMATSVRGSASLILRSRSVPERLGSFKSVTTISGGAVSSRFERRFGRFRLRAREIQALADGHAQPANALLVVHDQEAKSRFIFHGLPVIFSTAALSRSAPKAPLTPVTARPLPPMLRTHVLLPAGARETCSRRHPDYCARRSRLDARARFRSRCSGRAPFPCRLLWW